MWLPVLPVLGLIAGILLGLHFPLQIPLAYAKYLSVGVLAALDSTFGGLRSGLEGTFDTWVFITGFFGNALLAGILAYMGDQLGVDLYLAAVFAFGVRIFQNLAVTRRYLLQRWRKTHGE